MDEFESVLLEIDVVNDATAIRRLVVATFVVLFFGTPAPALDPNQPARDMLRTRFGTEDGMAGTVVGEVAQTKDGFLWLVTDGTILERFDGRRFVAFDEPLPGMAAATLAVAPDGDLWVGTPNGLLRIPSSSFNQSTLSGLVTYHPGPGKASGIVLLRFSRRGVLWVGTEDGLFRYDGKRFLPLGPRARTTRIEEAPDGNVLLTSAQGFTELAGSEAVPHPGLAGRLGVEEHEIFHVLRDRRGATWYCTPKGVARETKGRIETLGPYDRDGHAAYRIHEDPHGTIWIGMGEGLFRATPAGLELVAAGMQVRSLDSDRDGNLWVGTNGDGLYRFKDRAARTFTAADGLPGNVIQTVIAAHDGAVWTGANCGGITRFDGTRFRTWDQKDGLRNGCIWALAEDGNRDLWIGTWGGGAFHFHDGRFTQYGKSQGMADDVVIDIVAARDGSVWFATPGGLTRRKNGQFRTFTTADGLSANSVNRIFEDGAGILWVGTLQGLDWIDGERVGHFASLPRKKVFPFGKDRDGGFFVHYELRNHRLHQGFVDVFNFDASALIETDRGELWFGGSPIVRMQPGSFPHARARDEPLDYEAFSTADGLLAADVVTTGRTVAWTPDGKVWMATPRGLAMFDLRRLPVTKAKPSIYLTEVTIGRKKQPAGNKIVLPPGTSHVRIDFAAVEVSSPEKIRMQYRLDGVDSEWLDAARDPHAIYTKIPIGTRALRIRSCNRNGIWDRQGVVFTVTQLPYFYQTRWFVAAMLALGLLLVALAYRLRVAQISHRINARFNERLAERTRVAREIHDTFLQTVQGSKLVADHALKDPDDHERLVRAMKQLSAWLGQATEEGRTALNSLRAATTEKNDLAEALRRMIDECRAASGAGISFSVEGDSREMHPVVRDEIYRVAYEGIRNACTHSGGDRVEVLLAYGHDLTLRIGDNGAGIDPAVVEAGKDGHFGLCGMRERAERIDGTFKLVSAPGSGTVLTLNVPGRVAFRTQQRP